MSDPSTGPKCIEMKYFTHLIVCLVLVSACETLYLLDEDKDVARQIVISGYINQGPGPYHVKIQQTSFTGEAPTDVFNAQVTLVDEGGNREDFVAQTFIQDNKSKVNYRCPANIVKGYPGRSYHIEVVLADGRRYETEPDRMPFYQGQDEISWEETELITTSTLGLDVSVPAVKCHLTTRFQQQDEPIFLTWLGEETYAFFQTDFPDPFNNTPPPCYIIRPIGAEDLNLFTNVGYTKSEFEVPGIITRAIDKSFQIKHIFTLYQYSMSERNFQYMRSIEALTENSGSLFDTPPGVAYGNVIPDRQDENVQGFFQAVLMDTTRIAVFPNFLNTQVSDDCAYLSGTFEYDYPNICKNCTLLPNASLERPDYWVDTN